MSEADWMRQPSLRCEVCGGPGHFVPIPAPVDLAWVAKFGGPSAEPSYETHITCPEHRFLVIERAKRQRDPDGFARRHGRPGLDEPTEPEQIRRSLKILLDRLEASGIDVTELRAKVRDRFGDLE